jgi:hypothetical protein
MPLCDVQQYIAIAVGFVATVDGPIYARFADDSYGHNEYSL